MFLHGDEAFAMKELLSRFQEVRTEFIETLNRFPAPQRGEVLFGNWDLKDVVAHITGWDRYFVEILDHLESDEEPPYWKNMTGFNEGTLTKSRKSSWESVCAEFVSGGEEFIRRYADLPSELWDVRFWKGRSYTPQRMLEINIHHYGKSHLVQVRQKLDNLEKS